MFRGPTWIQVGFGEPPKPARQRRVLRRGCGRHGRRYNKTPRQSETATIHAGTSRLTVFPDDHRQATLTKFSAFSGGARGLETQRDLRTFLFGNWFSLPVRFAFIRVFRGLTQIQVRFGKMPKPARRGVRSPDITSSRKLPSRSRRILSFFPAFLIRSLPHSLGHVRLRTCERPR